jgi:RNA polymerase sigma-70 factor (ECF subfamily)
MENPASRFEGSVRLFSRTGADSEVVQKAVSAAKEGSSEALHFLYVRYAPEVLRCVRKLVRDDYEAEDITQNVFIKLMSVLPKYEQRPDVPFSAWVQRVARNAALDHLRARRSTPCEEVVVSDDERGRIRHERGRDLRQALEALPPEQRDVLILRHVVGLSPVEIASMLGKTESSVHGLHHRGRQSLQTTLEQLGAAPVVAAT